MPSKLYLDFIELFRSNDWLMTVFHIILRHLTLILFFLFRKEIDREAFLANDSNFDRNPLRGCNYGLEGCIFDFRGCSSLPKEEERLPEIMR